MDYSLAMLNNSILRFKKEIHSKVLDDDVIDLLSKNFVVPDEFSYRLVKIGPDMVARPDLLSYSLYSDDGYGDLICKLNGIQDPFELNTDMVVLCPSPEDIWRFITEDDYVEEDSIGAKQAPKPKKKKEKRRPMDATQDDVRYTIDSGRRIVVY